jgi:uncharacterized protein YbgA (DUF1722 family)/uncharacterized protein YbbK (DUF523 family)
MQGDTGEPTRIRLGISGCLLGEKVRFDGNHRLDSYISATLGRVFDFVSICPEVAIGMGVPRPPIRLEGDPVHPVAVGVQDRSVDVTAALEAFSRRQVTQLGDISGYILKSKSPSCGMERVKVYQPGAAPRNGSGVYARTLMERHPLLPVEEDGRLGDPALRDNFLERVFAYRRWQEFLAAGLTRSGLVEFHTIHKLTLMAHGAEHYRRLGQKVADAGNTPLRPLADEYIREFMAALAHRATAKRQTNVLHHLMGYLKRQLSPEDKAELLDVIEAYRGARVPLLIPVTLLKHHFRHHPTPYIERQVYLNPSPEEMLLRRGDV